jgi:hypothetical protein
MEHRAEGKEQRRFNVPGSAPPLAAEPASLIKSVEAKSAM